MAFKLKKLDDVPIVKGQKRRKSILEPARALETAIAFFVNCEGSLIARKGRAGALICIQSKQPARSVLWASSSKAGGEGCCPGFFAPRGTTTGQFVRVDAQFGQSPPLLPSGLAKRSAFIGSNLAQSDFWPGSNSPTCT